MWAFSTAVIVCGMLKLVSPCPAECRCSATAPRCAEGVSLEVDHCGCCLVCGRQLNEDCSGTQPCDRTKGLGCNFGSGSRGEHGICRAKSEARSCEYNSRIYQNGESFRPNCKHQCTCMDAAVACVSLCPQHVVLPRTGCDQHRLMKSPWRCCEQLLCLDQGGKRRRLQPDERGPLRTPRFRNELSDSRDELALPSRQYSSLAASTRDPELALGPSRCTARTSAWSPCSESCGPGVSSRLSYSNSRCKLRRETRMCEVRPCDQNALNSSEGQGNAIPLGRPIAAREIVPHGHR